MQVLWERELNCCYCGARIRAKDRDVTKFVYEDYIDGRVISVYYYVLCPGKGCYKDNTLENLHIDIKQVAKNELTHPKSSRNI